MRGISILLLAALGLAACGEAAAPSPAAAPPVASAPAPRPQPAPPMVLQPAEPSRSGPLPLAQVLAVARAAVPGEVIEVELDDDDDDDRGVYEVKMLTPEGRAIEITIDAVSGAVLEREED